MRVGIFFLNSITGAGTILDVLHGSLENLIKNETVAFEKPQPILIIVPNESLMDGHQSELAEELDRAGLVNTASIQSLPKSLIRASKIETSNKIAYQSNSQLNSVLRSLLES